METERAPTVPTSMGDDRAGGLTDADFSETVAPHHRRIDPDDWDDIYVVGDVHGCVAELDDLLGVLDPSEDDLVVFVGDLIRKGPDSLAVVERVRAADNMLAVRGNNEQKVIDGRKSVPELDPVRDYVASLPVAISFEDALVVHGGIDPRLPLDQHGIERLLTTRSVPPENGYDGPFWFEFHDGPQQVFFGHTVLDAPVVTEGAVGLDTGCVYGGSLTAYDYRRGELVSVPARDTYRTRADRKKLDLPDLQP